MENTMKKKGFKRILASVAAVTLILGATASMMTANAETYRIKHNFNTSLSNTYGGWCKNEYKPNKARANVNIYMSPGQTAKSTVRVTGATDNRTGSKNFSTVGSEQWVSNGWIQISDQVATSLNLSGTRYYNNGTNMQYDVYYYE